jgi:adenylate cyclase
MSTLTPLAERLKKSRPAMVLAVVILGASVGIGLSHFTPFDVLELKSLDLRFQNGSHPEWADTNVVIVSVDENSLKFFESTRGIKWEWPREFYALMLDFLEQAHPRLIAFDYEFSQPDRDLLEVDGKESDALFAAAMARSRNTVLGFRLDKLAEGDRQGRAIVPSHIQPNPPPREGRLLFDGVSAPIDQFQESAARLGVTNFDSDPDGIARHMPLVYQFGQALVPQFAFACYMLARDLSLSQMDSTARALSADDSDRFLLYWYGRGGPEGVFRYYSAHALIVSGVKLKAGLTPDISPEIFRNKCVLVGGTAAGLWDFKPTPFSHLEPYPGVEVQATLLSNLLSRHFLHPPGEWLVILSTLLLSGLAALVFFRVHPVGLATALVALSALLYAVLVFVAFTSYLVWLPVVGPGLGIVATYALAAVISYAMEGQQKRFLRRAFNRYFSPHVVAEILDRTEEVELGGKTIEATVFFSDIKDFTSIAERCSPKELVSLLNAYFSVATEVILQNEAMLDKYIGDAIMAIFGAPISRPDHAKVACLTSLQVQSALITYNNRPERTSTMPAFETRIGLHSGNMVIGNIGSSSRLDYTAIGDTVNLASRLEGVNKVFGTKIIISETTYLQAKEAIEVRPLDFLRVKGKAIPIRIYELVGPRGSVPAPLLEKSSLFDEGLRLYSMREFSRATAIFTQILSSDPHDMASSLYVKRCTDLAGQHLPDDWDGVYTMTSK